MDFLLPAIVFMAFLGDVVVGQSAGKECFFDGRRGVCVNFFRCTEFKDLINHSQKPVPEETLAYLRESYCGADEDNTSEDLVCCPVGSSTPSQTTRVATEECAPTCPQSVEDHPNLHLLPSEACGVTNDNRVFGGVATQLFEFPWMALIVQKIAGERYPQFACGGTILHARYVLTAAHCVARLPVDRKLLAVRVGEHDIRNVTDCHGPPTARVCAPKTQDFRVEKVIAHPGYDHVNGNHDIALVRLKAPIQFNVNAKPVCLPVERELQTQTLSGCNGVVAGWGATEQTVFSPILRQAELPIMSNARCREIYDQFTDEQHMDIEDWMMCAGAKGIDTCNGDSGGPLIYSGFYYGTVRNVQHGISFRGPRRCGSPLTPGIYVRVSYYLQWILDNLEP